MELLFPRNHTNNNISLSEISAIITNYLSDNDYIDGYTIAQSYASLVHTHGDYQATLFSGTNIKTINGSSILGSGNLVISGGSSSLVTLFWSGSGLSPVLSGGQYLIFSNDVNGSMTLRSYYDSTHYVTTTVYGGCFVNVRYQNIDTENPPMFMTSYAYLCGHALNGSATSGSVAYFNKGDYSDTYPMSVKAYYSYTYHVYKIG